MCGICGIINLEDEDLVRRMTKTLAHRGPDTQGTFTHNNISFGHTRLSIVDIENGYQPQCNEDGTIWLVYNGEIYNHQELREDLSKRGHTFRTKCDTEVIIHAYEEWGITEFTSHLLGVWALALYDSVKGLVLLSRDRLGVKPLFYHYLQDDMILFSSEIKASFAFEEWNPVVAHEAIKNFLGFRYNNLNQTILRGIWKVPPGSTLVFEKEPSGSGTYRLSKISEFFSCPPPPASYLSDQRVIAKTLRNLLESAVRQRLMGERKIAAFLSGGLDSSAVVGLMAQNLDILNTLETYSVGFGEGVENELAEARLIADHFGTDHTEIIIDPEQGVRYLPKVLWHLDSLTADLACVPRYIMSKKTQATVVLTGEGNDEVWGGYRHYFQQLRYHRFRRFLPLWLRRFAKRFGCKIPEGKLKEAFNHYVNYLDDSSSALLRAPVFNEFDKLLSPTMANACTNRTPKEESCGRYFSERFHRHLMDKMLWCDIRTLLPNHYLPQTDSVTMGVGIEARVPLVDSRIINFSFQVDPKLKVNLQHGEKPVFKWAMEDILPASVLKRKKRGFNVPTDQWLKNYFYEIEGLLLDDTSRRRGYFEESFVKKLCKKFLTEGTKNGPLTQKIWCLTTLELWHRIFLDKTLKPEVGAWT